jgi:hypothetical protein
MPTSLYWLVMFMLAFAALNGRSRCPCKLGRGFHGMMLGEVGKHLGPDPGGWEFESAGRSITSDGVPVNTAKFQFDIRK